MKPLDKDYMLDKLREFFLKKGRVPSAADFKRYNGYPNHTTYRSRFGSWNNAVTEAGLDINMQYYKTEELIQILKYWKEEHGRNPTFNDFKHAKPVNFVFIHRFKSWQGALKAAGLIDEINTETSCVKGRKAENIVFNSFEQSGAIDLAGQNSKSWCDGMCPNGKSYEVKSSSLHIYDDDVAGRWAYNLHNIYLGYVDYLFLIALDKDFKTPVHAWMIPIEIVLDKSQINIYDTNTSLGKWKDYEITERLNCFGVDQ